MEKRQYTDAEIRNYSLLLALFNTAMYGILFCIVLFACRWAFAAESWLCTTESSQLRGGAVYACGIGHGEREDIARMNALDAAQLEFKHLCKASDSCRDHKVVLIPMRTTCEELKNGWKCYRLIVYTIGNESAHRQVVAQETKAPTIYENYSSEDFWRNWKNSYYKPH